MDRLPNILHVIGPPFAGKTTFIRQHLQHLPVFDTKDFYRSLGPAGKNQFNLLPVDERASVFASAFTEQLTPDNMRTKTLVVESSGTNQALDYLFHHQKYPIYTLLIWTPERDIFARIYRLVRNAGINPERRYAMTQYFEHEIGFDPIDLLNYWNRRFYARTIHYNARCIVTTNPHTYIPNIQLDDLLEQGTLTAESLT